ncbi:MAG: protein kinase [Planctomycetaceae bacterium]
MLKTMLRQDLCNPQKIDDFLADRLEEDQRRAFEAHLDHCSECCQQLQHQSAGEHLWLEAREYLSDTEVQLTHGTASKTEQESSRHIRLDFLGPTDDPRMLGRLAGYEVSGVIGCGGMGIVLKAFDPALNRYAAIKVLAPHYATSDAARRRFARESQAAAAVIHENVIAIHGVSEFNQLPYLVMPYIKGESLQKRLDREGPLVVTEILRIALQTARGLAAAHQQGLVHRDIKPGNILLPVGVERVIITDFGLARAADDASLTRSGIIAGTPQYMSPEQARGEAVDSRSDLFSLGSMMYAMCAGRPPFEAETPYGVLRRITDSSPVHLSSINQSTPLWLCQIIDTLLEKEAAQRFDSANTVARILEQCLAHVQRPRDIELPAELRPAKTQTHRLLVVAGTVAVACGGLFWAIMNQGLSVDGQAKTKATSVADSHMMGSSSIDSTNTAATSSTTDRREDVAEDHTDSPEPDLRWQPDDEIGRIEDSIREMNQDFGHTD